MMFKFDKDVWLKEQILEAIECLINDEGCIDVEELAEYFNISPNEVEEVLGY